MTAGGDPLAPYRAVIAQAVADGALIERGAWADLVACGGRREAVMAGLPASPPDGALPLVAEAERLINANTLKVVAARDRTRAKLVELARGRRALSGYAGPRHRPRTGLDARS